MRKLVLVRPEPGLSESLERARALGLEAVGVPLFTIEPMVWDAPPADAFDGLLLTSRNAVTHGGPRLQHYARLPVHAVGEATAEAARAAGFEVTSIGAIGVAHLLADLPANLRLLHPCGQHQTVVEVRQAIVDVVIYMAVATDDVAFPPMQGAVVAIHSPRAGRQLASLIEQRDDIAIAAISTAAAQACGAGWQAVAVADHPTDHDLLALAAKLCQTPRP